MTSVEKTLPVLLGQRRRGKNDGVPQGAKGHCGYITFTYVVLTFTSRRCKIRDRVAGPLARRSPYSAQSTSNPRCRTAGGTGRPPAAPCPIREAASSKEPSSFHIHSDSEFRMSTNDDESVNKLHGFTHAHPHLTAHGPDSNCSCGECVLLF